MFWCTLIAFCVSTGLIVYTHLGYPILMIASAKWFGRPRRAVPIDHDDELPRISVLIAAYNAELHIERRLANLFDTDYPIERMEVVVATDGCTDQTARRARMAGFPHVRVIEFAQRRGKTATLVSSIPTLNHEVVVFSDATTSFDRQTLRELAQHFVDPSVGVVTGRVEMFDPEGKSAEGVYWTLETKLRAAEATFDALIGASGAAYAIRKSSFVPPTSVQLNDDLVLPMLSKLRTQMDFVLESNAVARVIAPADLRSDFRRRVRVGMGAYQSLHELKGLLLPTQGRLAMTFWSHKVLRWISPLLLLVALLSNALLWRYPWFQATMLVQAGFYFGALMGTFLPFRHPVTNSLRIASSFVVVNAAFAWGFVKWVHHRERSTWEPTIRPIETPQPHSRLTRGGNSRPARAQWQRRRIG